MRFLAVFLLFGCAVGITAPFTSPIIILALLISAKFRTISWPFFIVGIITGGLLIASSTLAFGSLDRADYPTIATYAGEENSRLEKNFLPLAALSFGIMGVLLGFVMHIKIRKPTTWSGTVVTAFFGSLLFSFVIGYLLLGIMSLLFVLPYAGPVQMPPIGGGIWGLTLIYPAGGFLIPSFTATLTKLCLDFINFGSRQTLHNTF